MSLFLQIIYAEIKRIKVFVVIPRKNFFVNWFHLYCEQLRCGGREE